MSEVKVTPLARRLAEENGIDWRRLTGTGPDNTVVERDILGFLAKVMAGEVSLPPALDEPAPPPDSIPNMAQAQALLQKEGVQLGDLMPNAPAQPPLAPPPTNAVRPTLDDLDFDFDFEAEPEMAPPVEPAPKSPTLLELLPEPELPTSPLNGHHPANATDLESMLEAKLPSLEPAHQQSAEPAHQPGDAQSARGHAAPGAEPFNPELAGLPPLPETELEPPLPAESPKLVWETQEVMPSRPTPEPEPLHPGMAFSSEAANIQSLAEELPPLPPLPDSPVPSPAEAAPPVHEDLPPAAAPVAIPSTPEPSSAPLEPVMPAIPRMLRLQAWQRMVHLKPSLEASQTLSEAWRTDVGLYALLYRAVDKALADTQLPLRATKGSLEGEELKSHRVIPTQTLRATLDSLHDASEAGEGLTVLSLVDGPFDQVVFPGATLLTLGRASGDQALLTLSAKVSHQEAGALLERIGYYLERPILLA
ncbi:MAG: E3 binding domain-containing protein [Thermaceae bacterium]|nr:E3 binding domain-containing protein [Thermaceae bacterium]